MRRFLTATFVLAFAASLGACGGDDSGDSPTTVGAQSTDTPITEAPTTDPPTTDAPETTASVTSADDEVRETAGESVDYWLTESFYPGSDISDVRTCLVDALVRDLSPDEIDRISFLDPEHSDEQDVAAVALAAPILDECIDAATYHAMAVATFEDVGGLDAECAADILTSEYSIGESVRDLYFGNAGEDEPSQTFIDLFTRMQTDCPPS